MKFTIVVCVLCSLIAVNEAAIAMARFNNPSECMRKKIKYKGKGLKNKVLLNNKMLSYIAISVGNTLKSQTVSMLWTKAPVKPTFMCLSFLNHPTIS